MSSDACLLAFLVSDLALALGSRASMALPRLMAPVPVIFALSASKPPGMDVQVFRHVRCCNALAEVLEAAAGCRGVLARQRLDLAGDGGVVAENFARRSVRHVGMRGSGASFMGVAHAGAGIGATSRRRATARMRRALSESWSAEGECHRCDDNQSRTFHVLPPFVWAGGDKTGFFAVLTEGLFYSS